MVRNPFDPTASMKLYHFPPAPNPAKLGFYLREKGLDIDIEIVDLTKGEHRSPEHLARNAAGTLPVLELDDGSYLTESLAIIEYLEELYPDPPMLGSNPRERARVRSAVMELELNVLGRIVRWVHATRSPLGIPPNPALAAYDAERLPIPLARLDARMADNDFVMGDQPTLADCVLLAALNFGKFADFEIPADLTHIKRWYELYPLRHL